jgi:hypothetical protein
MNIEQDELDYQELIAQVALIDKDAAEYMHGPMREITGFGPSGDLWDAVVWEDTAQGHDYWYNIAIQL